MFETSMPGVFAADDIRYGSVKRVASAVGAGAIAVSMPGGEEISPLLIAGVKGIEYGVLGAPGRLG